MTTITKARVEAIKGLLNTCAIRVRTGNLRLKVAQDFMYNIFIDDEERELFMSTVSNEELSKTSSEILQKMIKKANNMEIEADDNPSIFTEEEDKTVIINEGQKSFMDMFEIPKTYKKKIRDFAVTLLDPNDVPEEVRALIPEPDPSYLPDIEAAHVLLSAWENQDTTLIVGPTGAGKSELVKHCCAITNRPFIRINMTGDIDSAHVFGFVEAKDGSTQFADGPATEAVKYGGVLNIDEYDATPPDIAMGFQWLLENGGKLFLKEMPGKSTEKVVNPHPNFRVVFNGNTLGQGDDKGAFAGTQVQNTAMIDRIRTCIIMNYMQPSQEVKILNKNCTHLTNDTANKMVKFANMVRKEYMANNVGLTLSPRTIVNWGHKSAVYHDIKIALDFAYLNKLKESDRKVVDQMFKKVFGTTTS